MAFRLTWNLWMACRVDLHLLYLDEPARFAGMFWPPGWWIFRRFLSFVQKASQAEKKAFLVMM